MTNAGAVSGLTAIGTYRFIYTVAGCTDTVAVIRNAKPVAGNDQSICAPTTTATLTGFSPAGGTWAAQAGNPSAATVTNAGAVSGLTAIGTYRFIYTVAGCTDTVAVIRNAKPVAGTDQSICAPTTTATLTGFSPAGGTWAAQAGNPSAATVTNAGAVSGLTAIGTYRFIYTVAGCADTVAVIRNAKPVAGTDQSICAPTTTATLTGFSPAGGTWAAQAGNPSAATVTNAGAVSGLTAIGTYRFIYTVAGCADTVAVVRNAGPTIINLTPVTICSNQSLTYTDPIGTTGLWTGPGVSDTGTGASLSAAAALTQLGQLPPVTFYIYYTQTANGCSRTDSGQVTINPRPAVTITGPTVICSNNLPVNFTGTPAGGSFSLPNGLPAGAVTINNNVATLNPGFNITQLTFSYSYEDPTTLCSASASHTININAKPNAGTDQVLACINPATNILATTTTLTGTPTGGTWTQLANMPAVATVTNSGAVTGMSIAGTYQFIYSLNGCSDTVAVTVQPCAGCVNPNAGADQSICAPTTTATLTGFTPAGGTWVAQAGNPSAATVTNAGAVSGLTAVGTYRFIYSVTSGGQTCTDTVSVIRTAKPVAGTDQSICAPATTATLTGFSPAGGTWAAQTGNPSVATVTNAGAVSGLTTIGTYRFIYTVAGCTDTVSVIRNAKPIAGADQNLACINPVTNTLATTTTLTGTPAGGTWAQLGNMPAVATVTNAGAVSGMSIAGTYQFIYTTVAGCSDTVAVTVQPCVGCVKPNAGTNAAICLPTTTAKLTAVTTGGTWAPIGSPANPAAATIDANGNISGMTAAGTYRFVYSITGGGIVCTDTAQVMVNPKPTIAVANGFPACRQNGTAYTIKFTATAGTVTTVPSLTVTGDSIANIPLTTASVTLIITSAAGCQDSITVSAPVCDKPVGSIGDLIWKDVNDNGLQDLPSEKGVPGIKVNLYVASGGTKTGAVLQTKTTDNDGLYLFTGLMAGDYIVEIDKTTLPDTCQITTKQNILGDDTKDSDFNPTTGLSQVITLNPVFNPTTPAEILATDNLTVDAGLVVPCVKSSVALTDAPVCSADVQNYSITFHRNQ